MTTDADTRSSPDPELEALPKPRQPWRRLTLVILTATALASLALLYGLRAQLSYASQSGQPFELGDFATLKLDPQYDNRLVHASGALGNAALTYQRPLDGDHFRLVKTEGNDQLWVEVRIPADFDPARFIPPSSFIGRLVPVGKAGLGYSVLTSRARNDLSLSLPEDAWLLLDGEAPDGTRWVFGVALLLLGFLGFNIFGFVRIVRPVR